MQTALLLLQRRRRRRRLTHTKCPKMRCRFAILLLRRLSMMRAEQRGRETDCVGWRESRKTCPLWLTINKSTATLTAQRSLFCMPVYACVCVCALVVPLPSSKLFKTINIHLTQHVQLAAPTLSFSLSLPLSFPISHMCLEGVKNAIN